MGMRVTFSDIFNISAVQGRRAESSSGLGTGIFPPALNPLGCSTPIRERRTLRFACTR